MKTLTSLVLLLLIQLDISAQESTMGKVYLGPLFCQDSTSKALLNPFPDSSQLSISLIDFDTVHFVGLLKIEDTLAEIPNSDSVFEIGSVSKVFTSILLADIVGRGEISLDEHINSYYDFDFSNDIKISFASLANHTSGLPRLPSNLNHLAHPENPYQQYDSNSLETYLKSEMQLLKHEEPTSAYSNLGAGLLGYTLSKITKKNYEDLLLEKICLPLHLNRTTSHRSKIKSHLVLGRDTDGSITSNWDMASLVGAGGILSTSRDLAKFVQAHFDTTNRALALARKKHLLCLIPWILDWVG